MRIANPIYDVVFKYLLEDKDSAKLLLSEIIGEKIEELDFLPQERSVKIKKEEVSLTVYRLDFAGKIKLKDGSLKTVIIEIQKAKFTSDITRFRRYLGSQYRDKNNGSIPIISIYFIGWEMEKIESAIIGVKRNYYDLTTGRELSERHEFIESLTHDSFVVQIKRLKRPYKTEIERLLSVFDQEMITEESEHFLEIDEMQYPEKYRGLIRRLLKAASEKEVVDTMEIEDDILEELGNMERTIAVKDKALEEKDRILEEKDKIISELMKKLEER